MNVNKTDWSRKLNDTKWAYHTTFKTLICMSPYQLVFRKCCHLPVELENKTMCRFKKMNLDWDVTSSKRLNELNDL